jgi:gliding motility-associated-like protein
MPFVKRMLLMLLLLCNGIYFHAYAQKPVIIPKQNPILPLNDDGTYKILPEDVATYINHTDSPLVVQIKPQSVDCSMLGNQSVSVKALTNGAAPGNASPFSVSFPGNFISGVAYDTRGNLFVIEIDGHTVRKITPEGDVTIFAGSGRDGSTDGSGSAASFGQLNGLTTDANDNVYVSDITYHKIRKITPGGVVSTFAGTGFPGHADGPGTNASFNQPAALDIDANGNIYVADEYNGMIRKITPDGIVSTVVSTHFLPKSIAVGADGYIYFTNFGIGGKDDLTDLAVYRIKPGGNVEIYAGSDKGPKFTGDGHPPVFVGGPRLDMRFEQVQMLKFDSRGNLFVSEYHAIRMITPAGYGSTFLTGDLSYPQMTFDPCGNLVMGDVNSVIRYTMRKEKTFIASGNFTVLTGKVPNSPCQFATATIPVKVQSRPNLPVIQDKIVSGCVALADYTVQTSATDICPGTTITYAQSPAPGTLFLNNNSMDVTITATDNTGGTDSKTFKVTNTGLGTALPSVVVSFVGQPACQGDPASFHAAVTNGDAGTTYQWLVNGLNAGTNSADFTTVTLQDKDVVNCVVTTGGGCGVPNAVGGLTVAINPKPAITLNAAEQILAGKSIALNPVVSGNIVSYKWQPAEGLSDANSQFPVASPPVTTSYKLTVTTDKGCLNNASVTVNVVNQIIIPNTFTPNADGHNDLWAIKYLDAYTTCMVSIYSRNGGLVFQSKGYGSPWNGTSGGKALPAGVYFYIIDLNDGSLPLSGNVTIVR